MSVEGSFKFVSDTALNLHHLLYAEASSCESAETGERSKAQPMPAGELSVRAAPGFQEAVAYCRARLISGHLLFDQTLRDLSDQLVGRGGAAPEGWEAVFTPLLADYRSTDWSDHDQHNNRWSHAASVEPAKLFPEAIDRLQQVYRRRLARQPGERWRIRVVGATPDLVGCCGGEVRGAGDAVLGTASGGRILYRGLSGCRGGSKTWVSMASCAQFGKHHRSAETAVGSLFVFGRADGDRRSASPG